MNGKYDDHPDWYLVPISNISSSTLSQRTAIKLTNWRSFIPSCCKILLWAVEIADGGQEFNFNLTIVKEVDSIKSLN